MKSWNKKDIDKPLLIAGPCSAETREQVLAVAEQLKDQKVAYYRAGIWKPRTRPGAFEGAGSEGLAWLKEVKETYGMKITTEVANTQHVEECLKAGVDLLWIGARTTTSPFAVQEIAEALEGVDVPVLVKNPVNPDTKLWIGAIERLMKSGITEIGGIHRGFSVFEKKKYRNTPQWQIPVDLQQAFPDMPIICDPSHIGGQRDYIQEISQKAMDLNFDGLMIETHITPDEAWSDAAQQVTPQSLKEIVDSLVIRKVNPENVSMEELTELRSEINHLDDLLLEVLEKRMKISEKIGAYKMRNNMTILQKDRWESLLAKNVERASQFDISESFVKGMFKLIHQESINIQEEVFRRKEEVK